MSSVLNCSVPLNTEVGYSMNGYPHCGGSPPHGGGGWYHSNPHLSYWYCSPGSPQQSALHHVCMLPVLTSLTNNNTVVVGERGQLTNMAVTHSHSHMQISSPVSSSVSTIHTQTTNTRKSSVNSKSGYSTQSTTTNNSPVIAPTPLVVEGSVYSEDGTTSGSVLTTVVNLEKKILNGKNSSSNGKSSRFGPDILSPFMRGRIESLKRRYERDQMDEQMIIHLLSFLVSRSSQISGFTTNFTVYTVHDSLLEIFEVVLPEFNIEITSRIYNPAVAALERIVVLEPKFLDVKTFKVFEQAYGRIKQLPNAHADSAYMRLLFLFDQKLPSFNLGPNSNYTESGSILAMKFLVDRDKRYKKGSHNRKFFYLLCQAVLDHRS